MESSLSKPLQGLSDKQIQLNLLKVLDYEANFETLEINLPEEHKFQEFDVEKL